MQTKIDCPGTSKHTFSSYPADTATEQRLKEYNESLAVIFSHAAGWGKDNVNMIYRQFERCDKGMIGYFLSATEVLFYEQQDQVTYR